MAENYNYVMISLNDLAKFYDLLLKGEITDINNLITNIKDNYALNSSLDNYLTTVNANNIFLTKQDGLTKEEADKLYQPSSEGASDILDHNDFMKKLEPMPIGFESYNVQDVQFYFKKTGNTYENVTTEDLTEWEASQSFILYSSNVIQLNYNIYVFNNNTMSYDYLSSSQSLDPANMIESWRLNPNQTPYEYFVNLYGEDSVPNEYKNLDSFYYYNTITIDFLNKTQSGVLFTQQLSDIERVNYTATNLEGKPCATYADGAQYYTRQVFLDPVTNTNRLVYYAPVDITEEEFNNNPDNYYSKIASENEVQIQANRLTDYQSLLTSQINNLNDQIEALQSRIEDLEK